MADTSIEWTDKTWNPVVGCTKVSQGCKFCYAKTLHDKRHKAHLSGKNMPVQYAEPFETVQLKPERLNAPLSWRKPQRVFVNSVSDLFHEDVPFDFIDKVFAVMALCPQHIFQILTKRPERMQEYMSSVREDFVAEALWGNSFGAKLDSVQTIAAGRGRLTVEWPLKNVWLGTSVENQEAADKRIPHLLKTPAAVRFLSCEPLLGPVDLNLSRYYVRDLMDDDEYPFKLNHEFRTARADLLHWVIVGGESGHGSRLMATEWAEQIISGCQAAGVAAFFKQTGEKLARELSLENKKGGDWDELPTSLQIREFPHAIGEVK